MTEAAKTSIFVGIGVLTAVLAFAASREPAGPTVDLKTFTKIEDAADVASLKIVKFNDTTGKVEQFMVEYVDDHYVIPSHSGYPADAEQQLLDAAGSVMNIAILGDGTGDRRLHDKRGLIDPLDSEVGRDTAADTVGMRITMTDGDDNKLADFIIGHLNEKAGENVRFVRHAGQDLVYAVELDTASLTTNFEDWIEKDLLRLDPLDVRGVTLHDYSIKYKQGMFGGKQATGIDERASVGLSYDPQELKWKLDRLISFDQVARQAVPMVLADDQELDSTKLNGLKNALDDLKIVDVRKKPSVVTAENIEKADMVALQDLVAKGFYFNPAERQIISDQGEVNVDMANGVRYVLRFGRIAGSEEKAAEGEAAEGDPANGEAAGRDIHRYLWVSVEENLGIFPQAALKPVPAMPEAPAVVEKVEKVEPGEGGEGDDAPSAEDRKKEFERLTAEREKVIRNNERKVSEYKAKITGAKEAVAKLNRRFDDWYYVIADDTYKQIHLGRDDIIKTKKVPEAAAAHGAAAHGGAAGAASAPSASFLEKNLKEKLDGLLSGGAAKPVEGAAPAPVEDEPATEATSEETPAETVVEEPADDAPAEKTPAEGT